MARVMLGCFVLFSALAGAMEGRSSRRRRPLGFLFRKEEPWLFEFSGYGSAYVKKYMADTVKMIEKKYKTKLHTFDVYKDPAAYKFWLLIIRDPLTGKEMTKGLPLYYNRKTGGIVSGMTTVDNFDKWAGGSGDHDVDCPPLISASDLQTINRITGKFARMQRYGEQSVKDDATAVEGPDTPPDVRKMEPDTEEPRVQPD